MKFFGRIQEKPVGIKNEDRNSSLKDGQLHSPEGGSPENSPPPLPKTKSKGHSIGLRGTLFEKIRPCSYPIDLYQCRSDIKKKPTRFTPDSPKLREEYPDCGLRLNAREESFFCSKGEDDPDLFLIDDLIDDLSPA